jgi:hypothetical protein
MVAGGAARYTTGRGYAMFLKTAAAASVRAVAGEQADDQENTCDDQQDLQTLDEQANAAEQQREYQKHYNQTHFDFPS